MTRPHLLSNSPTADSAQPVCPYIAEGFSRYFPKDFARFLRIAGGSLSEVMDHLGVARERELVAPKEAEAILSLARRARAACTK